MMPRLFGLLRAVGRPVVVLPLCATVLAAAFGTGHQVARAVQNDGGAWLASGDRLAHVGPAGRVDAVAEDENGRQLTLGERSQVSTSPFGVMTYDPGTGTASRVEPGTARVTDTAQVRQGTASGSFTLLTGSRSAYLLSQERGTVHALDLKSLDRRWTVETGGPLAGGVVDGAGDIWVLDAEGGRVDRIRESTRHSVEVGSDPTARITLTGDRPVVVKPGSGQVVPIDGDESGTPVRVPLQGDGRVLAGAPSPDATHVWMVQEGRPAALVRTDLRTGAVEQRNLGGADGARLGRPVVAGGRVYVPDHTHHRVLVLNANTLAAAQQPIDVPRPDTDVRERAEPVEVRLENGKVWIHDQLAPDGTVVDTQNPDRATPFSKRTDGSRGDRAPATTTTTTTTTTLPPARSDPPDTSAAPDPPAGEQPGGGGHEPVRVVVPDVTGDDIDDACTALRDAGLTCKPDGVPDEEAAPDTVLTTDPPAGAKAAPGWIVNVKYAEEEVEGNVGGEEPPGDDPPEDLPPTTVQEQPPEPPVAPAPQPATVPNVTGLPVQQACQVIGAAGFVCQTAAVPAPFRPNVVHNQNPAQGAAAQPGTDVTVSYDASQLVPLWRLKREGAPIWLISTHEPRIDRLQDSGKYVARKAIGLAYLPDAAAPHLATVHSFRRPSNQHGGDNLYFSNSPQRGGNWVRFGGIAAVVLTQQHQPEMIPLYRLIRTEGANDFTYSTPTDLAYYKDHGFKEDGIIGWVWPPP